MPRVALVCEYPTLHGGERSLLAVLPAVEAAGFEPVVLAPPDGPLAEELAGRGLQHVPFDCRAGEGSERRERTRGALEELLSALAVDLLHANSLSMARLSGPVAAALCLPSVGHLRDIVQLSGPAVAELSLHTRLLAVSQATREFHMSQGLAAERIHVLYNGIDPAAFLRSEQRGALAESLGLPPRARLVGNIGQVILRKGQDVLCTAFETVAARVEDVHLLLVGERSSEKLETVEYARQLQYRAQQAPLAGRVHLLGARHDVAQWLGQLELLAHAAHQEPLGRVLLEAASAGVPVVATDCGGTREIFGAGEEATARLVPVKDPRALAEGMLEVLADPAGWRARAARAQRRVGERFDLQRAAAGLVGHYREVLAGGVVDDRDDR